MSEFQTYHGRANPKLVGSSLCYRIAIIRDDHLGLLANWLQVSCKQVTTILSLQSSVIRSDGSIGYFVRLHSLYHMGLYAGQCSSSAYPLTVPLMQHPPISHVRLPEVGVCNYVTSFHRQMIDGLHDAIQLCLSSSSG